MRYLVLIDNSEREFDSEEALVAAFERGEIDSGTWIKEADVESDWIPLEEMFPEWA